jgi:LysR family glycine cleavage system transcriptional activator
MEHSLPPLNWLRAFEASARHLSFTQAAQELNQTQAGVSKQIKLLEHNLGAPLFSRGARSLQLTSSGAAFLPKVRDAFERLSLGASEVFGNRRSRILTVRCNVSFAVNWLARRLEGFGTDHPDKPVRILSNVWRPAAEGSVIRRPEDERHDLDIQYGAGRTAGTRCDRLTSERLFPVCSPEFLQRRSVETPQDLSKRRLINVLGYEDSWATWLRTAEVDADGLTYQHVDTSLMAYELAAQGWGIALGRTSLVERDLASKRFVQIFDLSVETREGFFLHSPDVQFEHPHAGAFRDWLIASSHGRERPSDREKGSARDSSVG